MDRHPATGLPVSEYDFRMHEFRDAKVEDYEWREDGKLVRKDRWENGMRSIAYALGFDAREGFEIEDVVALARELAARRTPEQPE